MTTDQLVYLLKKFQLKTIALIILALLFLSGLIWIITHFSAKPGERVRILFGLVEYTKDQDNDKFKDKYNENNENPCKGNKTDIIDDANLEDLFSRGIDKSRYFEINDKRSISLDRIKKSELSRWRISALKDMISAHLDADKIEISNSSILDRWYMNTNLIPLLTDEIELYNNLINKKGNISKFITLYNHRAYFDCINRTYNYNITFLIPSNSFMIFPEEMRGPIKELLNNLYDDKLKQLYDRKSITINLYFDIFLIMLNDKNFRHKIANIFDKSSSISPEILQYFDPSTQDFFSNILDNTIPISSFSTGEYNLSGDMIYLLEEFTKRFLKIRNNKFHYKIICEGFSDIRPIKNKISYYGNANLLLEKHTPKEFNINRDNNSTTITNNLSLSIARAYNGTKIINKVLDSELIGEERKSVILFYSGGGEIGESPLAAYRRIELTITKTNLETHGGNRFYEN